MKPLELTDDLKTGIDTIDDQHRALLMWANAVSNDSVLADQDKLKAALDNLDDYVKFHFREEEEAMKTHGYNRLKKHKAQHDRLMGEVSELYGRLYREGASKALMVEVQDMFAGWYTLHIKEWDKPFAAFLKSRNVSAF